MTSCISPNINPSNYPTISSFSPCKRSKENKREHSELIFSSKQQLITAIAVSAVAMATLSISVLIATPFAGIALWLLSSAAISYLKQNDHLSAIEETLRKVYAISQDINTNILSSFLIGVPLLTDCNIARGNLKAKPILFVHGYGSYGAIWEYQKQKLLEAGLGPLYSIDLPSGSSIETYAKQLQSKVEQIQKETGKKEIAIVGHSRGGLVSTYFAVNLAKNINAKVTDVITIASPFKGTELAQHGFGEDAQQMMIGSDFLKKLRENTLNQREIHFGHIYSLNDMVVSGESAAFKENTARRMEVPDLGHTSLLFSSTISDKITSWLREGDESNCLKGLQVKIGNDQRLALSKKNIRSTRIKKENTIKVHCWLASFFHDTVAFRVQMADSTKMKTWYLDRASCVRWLNKRVEKNMHLKKSADDCKIRSRLSNTKI